MENQQQTQTPTLSVDEILEEWGYDDADEIYTPLKFWLLMNFEHVIVSYI